MTDPLTVLLLASSFLLAVTAQEEEYEPKTAILFPWFSEALGVIVFYILTRSMYIKVFPFTAIMFLIGTAMGVGAARLNNTDDLTISIIQWSGIDSEVILLVFLPGLIFNDAFALDVHLFVVSFWQVITLAFPMVLAGTALTAVVVFYLFPYGWSFNLSMTVGAILAATDPVAVSALMDSLGAPPRLQILIGGESMLNDGSSYVFYVIFSALYLLELEIPGVGEDVDVARGFAIFFRMALGGMAYGLAFGLGLVVFLYILNRQLESDENITQITATITVAYLAYYTADISECSGVISTVFCGLTAKALGNSMINAPDMMTSFWGIVDNLLNTLLFALAGAVWGGILVRDSFTGRDWGNIVLLWVFLNIIRFFLVFAFYPLISRIGLGCDWQSAVFMSYSGLRGAVAISLGVSLYSQVLEATEDDGVTGETKYTEQAAQVFGMLGGIVFFMLFVNGTTCGPLLKKLGLIKSPDVRVKLLHDMEHTLRESLLDSFVQLLADPRFRNVDFAIVRDHVKFLQSLTLNELKLAVLRNKDVTPNLTSVLDYLGAPEADYEWAESYSKSKPKSDHSEDYKYTVDKDKDESMDTEELRHFFLGLLSTVYNDMINDGEIDGRNGFVSYSLVQSIDLADADVSKGKELDDWDSAHIVSSDLANPVVQLLAKQVFSLEKCHKRHGPGDDRGRTVQYQKLRVEVLRGLAFIQGHRKALQKFKTQFAGDAGEFSSSEQVVADESNKEVQEAKYQLARVDKKDLDFITAHYFCTILLSQTAAIIENLLAGGVLQEREATGYFDQIQKSMEYVSTCSGESHEHGKHTVEKGVPQDEEQPAPALHEQEPLKKDDDEEVDDYGYSFTGTPVMKASSVGRGSYASDSEYDA